MKFNNSVFNWICLLVIIVILLIGATSCSSSKNISTTNRQVDSTVINEKDSIIQVQITEIERLTAEIRELQYAGVTFDNDSSLHPVILIEKGIDCNVDSIMTIMDFYKNKVKISADGTIEAEGKLKSAFYSRDKLSRFIAELQHRYDSLSAIKQKEVVKVVTNEVIINKKKKTSLLNQWWLFPAGMIFMAGVFYRKKILSFLRA